MSQLRQGKTKTKQHCPYMTEKTCPSQALLNLIGMYLANMQGLTKNIQDMPAARFTSRTRPYSQGKGPDWIWQWERAFKLSGEYESRLAFLLSVTLIFSFSLQSFSSHEQAKPCNY